ncbi:hypothetical protein JK211_13185 [Tatumella sp. JGM130]|uniref:protein YgfX n=1 Tax=Tatumella sp. JGM130 TaxID=2799797 RepID=UPI001BB07791|nr:protein YgfX [Tatumella sp. JGM130]MBS0894969.1 hypothetical protein [Tatumella sp. JGM130]
MHYAARWHAELTASRLALRIQTVLQGLVLLALLCSPWPLPWLPVKLLAGWLMWREGKQARRRLAERRGRLEVDEQGIWYWQQQQWRTRGNPGWLPCGVLLCLENSRRQQLRFWLMQDAMPAGDWRGLRMHWFYCRRFPVA